MSRSLSRIIVTHPDDDHWVSIGKMVANGFANEIANSKVGDNIRAVHKGPRATAPLFPSPADLRWEEITITLDSVDEERVRINARGIVKRFRFAELGLVDRRNGKLNQDASLLRLLTEWNGKITWMDCGHPKLKKRVSTLRDRLRAIFGISGDPFFPYDKTRHAYVAKFVIRMSGICPSHDDGSED